jgi:hypothetical protein
VGEGLDVAVELDRTIWLGLWVGDGGAIGAGGPAWSTGTNAVGSGGADATYWRCDAGCPAGGPAGSLSQGYEVWTSENVTPFAKLV